MFAITISIPKTNQEEIVAYLNTPEEVNSYMRSTMNATVAFANFQDQQAEFVPVEAGQDIAYNLIIDGELMSTMKASMIQTRPPGVTLH